MKQAQGSIMETRGPASPASSIIVTREGQAWLDALFARGLMQFDSMGSVSFDPGVRDLVQAIHVVLAGGSVEVRVKDGGDASIREDLDARLADSLDSATVLNAKNGPDTFTP